MRRVPPDVFVVDGGTRAAAPAPPRGTARACLAVPSRRRRERNRKAICVTYYHFGAPQVAAPGRPECFCSPSNTGGESPMRDALSRTWDGRGPVFARAWPPPPPRPVRDLDLRSEEGIEKVLARGRFGRSSPPDLNKPPRRMFCCLRGKIVNEKIPACVATKQSGYARPPVEIPVIRTRQLRRARLLGEGRAIAVGDDRIIRIGPKASPEARATASAARRIAPARERTQRWRFIRARGRIDPLLADRQVRVGPGQSVDSVLVGLRRDAKTTGKHAPPAKSGPVRAGETVFLAQRALREPVHAAESSEIRDRPA